MSTRPSSPASVSESECAMKIIDTHCHLYDVQFQDDLSAVVQACKDVGVVYAFNNADCFEAFEKILDLAKKDPFFRSVLGIHPEFANDKESFQKAMAFLQENRMVYDAVGEIGLDYHFDKTEETKQAQKAIFIEQLRFAKKYDLPVVIHSRDADKDTFDIVKEELPPKVDLHCYSGSVETFLCYLRLPIDFHIGVGGVLTFKNARVLKEVVDKADLSRLLTETDAPYLAPTPHRGQRNTPAYIPLVIEAIAAIKDVDKEKCAETLYQNAEDFYGIH